MKRCPICNGPIYEINYGDYWSPAETYSECRNKKCGKYLDNYFYYTGVTMKIGNWTLIESDLDHKMTEYEYEKAFKEFNLRRRYYHKKRYGKK